MEKNMPEKIQNERSRQRKKLSKLFGFLIFVGVFLIILGVLASIKIIPYNTYTHPGYALEVKYPAYWAYYNRQEKGAVVAFVAPQTDPADNFWENVVITCEDFGGKFTNPGQLNRMIVKQITGTFEGYIKVLGSGNVSLGKLPAYKLVYKGQVAGAGESIQYMHIWTLVGTKVYTVTYIARASTFNNYLKEVNGIIRSFKIITPKEKSQ
jgi:hypothetical protein